MDDVLTPAGVQDSSAAGDTMSRVRKTFATSLGRTLPDDDGRDQQLFDEAASLDSIAVLEFMTALESEFGIVLEQKAIEFDFLRDFAALAHYIDDRVRERSDAEPRRVSAGAGQE